ncbi:hypothetical protein P171DRAFT_427141 [Karstenula rhodostoma CBS 690.94]|uniref:PLP-dependent transferase n=1 Tax=Karstenula rhodostoma CBS 690.94 TaxID=1392251 RepID=A0A9P4PV77_9PLEO|nr:hypothetical protein P171DRAFT_427141 [Karstenula rhodostoma CBS 690.94]
MPPIRTSKPPTEPAEEPTCRECRQTAHVLGIKIDRVKKGDLVAHERLCQGLDPTGKPLGLPTACLAPGCEITADGALAWVHHYRRVHTISISLEFTLKQLRLRYQKDLLPDFDMNAGWGSHLTKQSPFFASLEIQKLHNESSNPWSFTPKHKDVLQKFRSSFREFFGATPLSFHQHVSDISPILVARVITFLEENSVEPVSGKITASQRKAPQFAAFEGQFGAYYGPLAHGGSNNESHRIGPTPIILSLDLASNKEKLKTKFKSLVKAGYIAVIMEVVRQTDGHILSQLQWEAICQCCQSTGLYLIVDESLTAIRCGAPFGHQLPQFCNYKPSFVFFGKALSPGLGIFWDGVRIDRFEVGERADVLALWDFLPSLVQEPAATLRSWGTIVLAQREDWPKRAKNVGRILRDVLREMYPGVDLRGEAALIYIPTTVSRIADVIGAATPTYCRWMPYLDLGMMEERQVRAMFGTQSHSLRQTLKVTLGRMNKFCIICSEEAADSFDFCERCCGHICSVCKGEDGSSFQRHSEGRYLA